MGDLTVAKYPAKVNTIKTYEDHVFLFAKQYKCTWLCVHLLATLPSDVFFPSLESSTPWGKKKAKKPKQSNKENQMEKKSELVKTCT